MKNVVSTPIIFFLLIYFESTTGSDKMVSQQINEPKNQVVSDAIIDQSNYTKRNRLEIKTFFLEGFVANTFFTAEVKEKHSKWKKIKNQKEQKVKNVKIYLS